MTRQYVCGELSLRLGWLQGAAGVGRAAKIEKLRHRAESVPPDALASIVTQVLHLCRQSCWDALAEGDIAAFDRRAASAAELREFAVCAQLLDED